MKTPDELRALHATIDGRWKRFNYIGERDLNKIRRSIGKSRTGSELHVSICECVDEKIAALIVAMHESLIPILDRLAAAEREVAVWRAYDEGRIHANKLTPDPNPWMAYAANRLMAAEYFPTRYAALEAAYGRMKDGT